MASLHSFKEYVAKRFYDELYNAIDSYLDENKDSVDLKLHKVRNIESLELTDIDVKFVSVNDLPEMAIEFDVVVEAEISARELDYHYDETEECHQWFMIHCSGDLDIELNDFQIHSIEEYTSKNKQPNPMSDALVPIIGKDELDKKAEEFLKKHYPKALLEPCYVDPTELAQNMGLTVKYAHITKDASIFGRCYFKDCETELYNPVTDSTYTELITAKTILVDKDVAFLRNLGTLNNTIIHECVHWYLHRKSFVLAQLYDDSLSSIGCKVVGGIAGNNRDDFDWMEWQANALAPRIQMPQTGFKKKVNQFVSEIRVTIHEYDFIDIMETVIDKLAAEFCVSRLAAKIRMVDAGYDAAIGAFNFIDGRYVQPHKARKDYLAANRTFSIGTKKAAILCLTNSELRKKLDEGQYQFVDSHFVLNCPTFLETDMVGDTHLTRYARNHMDECCLVFELSVASKIENKYHSECFLDRDERSDIDLKVNFHNGYENSPSETQIKKMKESVSDANALLRQLPNDFALALEKPIEWENNKIEKYNKKHPNNKKDKITAVEIANRTGLNEATVRRAIKGDKNTSTNTLVLICLALHLPYNISSYIISISPHPLVLKDPNHQWYNFALQVHYGLLVDETKKLLESYGAAPLIKDEGKESDK